MMNNQQTPRPKRRGGCCSGCALLLLLSLCLVGAGVLVSYPVAQNTIHPKILETYAPLGEMVDVGGYNLHLYCLGEGGPTVIVDVQWSATSPDWQPIQSLLSQTNRTCLFDRAGRAWSDPSPHPREVQVMAEELHTTLNSSGIVSDYILLGEGEASQYALYYAGQYTDEMQGLALVTPALYNPKEWADADRVNHLLWVMTTPFDVLTWLTSNGEKFFALEGECPPSYSQEACTLDNIWTHDIQDQRTVSAELDLWETNNIALDNAAIKLGALPLVVVYSKNFYGEESVKKLDAILALSTRSTALPQDQSSIRDETPDAIVNAVLSLTR